LLCHFGWCKLLCLFAAAHGELASVAAAKDLGGVHLVGSNFP
jgi:hypothetical protein